MKKTITIVTGTRAEFGLLKPVISAFLKLNNVDLRIVATGMHLHEHFGFTYREIEQEGFPIHKKIDIITDIFTPVGILNNISITIKKFSEYFSNYKPDILVLLGDRYETFAVATAAAVLAIPIAHLYGGDTTEGATDEFFRHSITKMSCLHFVSCEQSRKRVIQLGENPNCIFNVGSLGVENILTTKLLSKQELEHSIGFNLGEKYSIVTFHPVTLENIDIAIQFQELLDAIDEFKDMKFIFTKANSDANGNIINNMIDEYVSRNKKMTVAFKSLGLLRYLSAMKHCKLVIGNSSSGIYEAPSLNVVTIDIGDRQKGRTRAESVINCQTYKAEIIKAINAGLAKDAKNVENPYFQPNTSNTIVKTIMNVLEKGNISLKKRFYDCECNI